MKVRRWKVCAVSGLLALLAFGGVALAEEPGNDGTSDSSDYVTEEGNILEDTTVTDAVYERPCRATVGGVTIEVPACDRVTRHAILPVRFPDLPAGTVVSLGVHRPGRNEGHGYLVRGDGTTKHVRLELLPGINVITVTANNEVKNFRVIRVGPGHRLRAFRDVARDHWARGQVDQLAALGAFDGYLDGDRFDLNRPATRGDVAWFLDRIVNVDPVEEGGAEVPADARPHRAAGAIHRIMKQGLMRGVGEGRFAPDGQLTRAQVATLLDRALPPVPVNLDLDAEFRDGRQVPAWAREAMVRMRARGLVSGYEDKTLRPDRPLTRAELAVLLARFMEYRNAGGH